MPPGEKNPKPEVLGFGCLSKVINIQHSLGSQKKTKNCHLPFFWEGEERTYFILLTPAVVRSLDAENEKVRIF